MSVYGYPREPEGTGDEIPPPDVPYRVTSQPVSVPSNPPPDPLLSPVPAPPQPLLPAHPPGTPYAPAADFIPTQRHAIAPESVPVAAPEARMGGPAPEARIGGPAPEARTGGTPPDVSDPRSGRHRTEPEGDAEPFEWLRPRSQGRPGPSVDAPAASPPTAEPPSPTVPPETATRPVSPPAFGPPAAMGQAPPADPSPRTGGLPMGQPPASEWGPPEWAAPEWSPPEWATASPLAGLGQPGPADGAAASGPTGTATATPPTEDVAEPARPPASPLPRRTSGLAAGLSGGGLTGSLAPDAPTAAPVSPPAAAPVSPPAPPSEPTAASEPTPAPGSTPAPGPAPAAEPPAPFGPPAPVPPEPPAPPASSDQPTGPSITRPPVVDDAPEIPPWDRKPLLVVIASAVVLVLIGIVSGIVTAAIASSPNASWNDSGTPATPDPGAGPSTDPAVAPSLTNAAITLAGVGDVIMGSVNLGVPPNGGAGFFDPVRDALAADLVMGNLDMALSEATGFAKCSPGATDCFQLSLPPAYAGVLRDGGFHLMSLANNHTYDMGQQGYANTRAALDSVGIAYTGGVDEIAYVTVKGVKVAVVGFSVYSYTANLNNIEGAAELVRQAAGQADLVVVQMQGGAEGSDRTHVPPAGQHEFFGGEDRGDLRGFAHAVIDAGADIVFGHGPHVMRGMEFYQGRLIAYSLGNFCGYSVLSSSGWSGVGGILKATLTRDGSWVSGQLVATEMVNRGLPAIDADLRALAFVDGLSVEDFGATAARIDHATGVITAP